MCLAQFFGELSPFEIIVAVVAFVTGGYTFYKSVEGANVSLNPGDRFALVIGRAGRTLQVRGTLTNRAVKTGVVQRLEATLTTPEGVAHLLPWHLFFAYSAGTLNVEPAGAASPVSLPGHSSQALLSAFELPASEAAPRWGGGRYRVDIRGWVNRDRRTHRPNLRATFHFSLADNVAQQVRDERREPPVYVDVPIEEWDERASNG